MYLQINEIFCKVPFAQMKTKIIAVFYKCYIHLFCEKQTNIYYISPVKVYALCSTYIFSFKIL